MKKRVWILNHYAIPPTIGGITRHFDYAKELVKRGYDVTIFASSFDHKQRVEMLEKGSKFKIEDYSGVGFVWIKTTPYKKNDLKRVINILSFAKNLYFIAKNFEKPDTIIASSFHPLTWVVGYWLSKKKKADFVAEVRDLWPQSGIDLGAFKEGSLIVRLLRRLEKFIYTKAKYVITVLPKADEYIQSLGISKEKIVHISNGCDVERFDSLKDSVPEEVKKILDEHEGYFKACYLGALGKANAMETIIEAAKYVQEKVDDRIHFLIIGDGPEKEKLERMAKELNLANVFFYDPVSKLSVPGLLERVDITLVSMHNLKVYRFGISLNKLFDYLCAAKPIVFAGNVANDIVKDSGAGISCDAYDSKGFAEGIIKLYEMSEDERKRMGQKGREYVEKYHDIKKLADRLEQIINGDGN
ncbi:glycosyltransferase family 4 protein [Caldicellulosiruptor morganii]|uniref:Glycosyltransferase family 4 protein n=1 Tax=Caldicellulosiruptor morganii TaxID=1387555 RepID=A0ABY7BNN6_9FIRM|nr:glycosyltransferase family 4 protein [Caldicellulosiruptor morganii]WAM34184.1 glycosyltransferase family 4 protein [Caldicellulosiruptor morganii]